MKPTVLINLSLSRERLEVDILPESEKYTPLGGGNFETLRSVHKNKKFTLIAASDTQLKAAGIFELKGITVKTSGIVLNLIGPDEIILSLNRHEKKRRRRRTSILLDDLKVGDYVVHEEYGVGIFVGIEQAEILGGIKDLVVIKYMGDDKLLLPVENLDAIDRYIASGSSLSRSSRQREFRQAQRVCQSAVVRDRFGDCGDGGKPCT
jgi:transcription-repair coupling factor (superfamily II helicase)